MIRHHMTLALFCLLLVAVGAVVDAQDTTQDPVIYQDFAFPDLPYPSKWVEVDGIRLHYLEGGDLSADPILFLHGVPTWSYIWRDILPIVEPAGHVIALDYVGFGRSDKLPADEAEIGYGFNRQLAYRIQALARESHAALAAVDETSLALASGACGSAPSGCRAKGLDTAPQSGYTIRSVEPANIAPTRW